MVVVVVVVVMVVVVVAMKLVVVVVVEVVDEHTDTCKYVSVSAFQHAVASACQCVQVRPWCERLFQASYREIQSSESLQSL